MMKRETAFNIQNAKLSVPISKRDHIQGSLEAPLKLVEYADYQCPYCGEAYPSVKAVQERLGDQLCFAFRNFPLVEMHPRAEPAAEAAESAGAQGRFWEMHDRYLKTRKPLRMITCSNMPGPSTLMSRASSANLNPMHIYHAYRRILPVERAAEFKARPLSSSTACGTKANTIPTP